MIILTVLGLLVALAGVVGCFLPILPGPVFSYLSILILSFSKDWTPFGTPFLIVTGILVVILIITDYVVPAMGAKRYGATRMGIWGSVIGMIAGIFVFPPFGMLILAFTGALLGEIITGQKPTQAIKAGWGIILGNLVSAALKFSYSGVLLVLYVINMF